LSSIGDGLSQPAAMAAGLSTFPRLAGTASGVMGFLQMTVSALGTFIVALLAHDSALGMILVVGGFIAMAFAFGIFAVRQTPGGWRRPLLAGIAPAQTGPAPAEGS